MSNGDADEESLWLLELLEYNRRPAPCLVSVTCYIDGSSLVTPTLIQNQGTANAPQGIVPLQSLKLPAPKSLDLEDCLGATDALMHDCFGSKWFPMGK